MGVVRIIAVILAIVAMTLVLVPFQLAGIITNSRLAVWVPLIWHRLARRLLRIRIRVIGSPVTREPALFVSNHVSWVDIVTMGATLPASFVAKYEVGTWPGIKYLANLQRTIYVSRDRKTAELERKKMTGRLERGDSLILFPEGTSYDGLRIGEFRTAFFSLADLRPNDKPLKVQPFSVTYTKVDGFPVSRRSMDKVAWYGDMDLAPHLADFITGGPYECTLTFFEPVSMEAMGNRKQLARHCRDRIVQGNSDALSGVHSPIART
ncbi:MAG: lysophospholipid acyltransferase family protein [Minwuia sp.]|uniref:lysophospholipid acyltransferase family protein n=1 Tax=Minwuia sp. TaxID=2493630 RepID=UPI003A8AB30A